MKDFPPLAILLEEGAAIFVIDFARYLIAAGITSLVVWSLRRSRFATRKIQPREAAAADRLREFLQSVQTVVVYVIVGVLLLWGVNAGMLRGFSGSHGIAIDMALLAATIMAHDAYFYWLHRAMHHPRLFRYFHRAHHRSVTPTAWATYSFAIPEAFVMAAFVPIWLTIAAVPAWVMFLWANFQIIRNAMGHAGFELHPRWWLSSPLTRWINTTTHHDLHHAGGFDTNYGLYFTWWDRWMGTEHPRYAARFAEVVADRSAGTPPPPPSTANAQPPSRRDRTRPPPLSPRSYKLEGRLLAASLPSINLRCQFSFDTVMNLIVTQGYLPKKRQLYLER